MKKTILSSILFIAATLTAMAQGVIKPAITPPTNFCHLKLFITIAPILSKNLLCIKTKVDYAYSIHSQPLNVFRKRLNFD